jgi:hypothetical protein
VRGGPDRGCRRRPARAAGGPHGVWLMKGLKSPLHSSY